MLIGLFIGICLTITILFVKLYKNESVDGFLSEGHSKDGEIIDLAPIQDSDCYQLIQGNHRCACAVASGKSHIKAKISKKKITRTPVQFLLENLPKTNQIFLVLIQQHPLLGNHSLDLYNRQDHLLQ